MISKFLPPLKPMKRCYIDKIEIINHFSMLYSWDSLDILLLRTCSPLVAFQHRNSISVNCCQGRSGSPQRLIHAGMVVRIMKMSNDISITLYVLYSFRVVSEWNKLRAFSAIFIFNGFINLRNSMIIYLCQNPIFKFCLNKHYF